MIARYRQEIAEYKTEAYSLGVKVQLMEGKIKEEIKRNVILN